MNRLSGKATAPFAPGRCPSLPSAQNPVPSFLAHSTSFLPLPSPGALPWHPVPGRRPQHVLHCSFPPRAGTTWVGSSAESGDWSERSWTPGEKSSSNTVEAGQRGQCTWGPQGEGTDHPPLWESPGARCPLTTWPRGPSESEEIGFPVLTETPLPSPLPYPY